MRFRRSNHKPDANRNKITEALRLAGVAVFDTGCVGNGFSDLVCAIKGCTWLVEVKNPDGDMKLTEAEAKFHAQWPDQMWIVSTVEQALGMVRAMRAFTGAKAKLNEDRKAIEKKC